ncbi:Protein phosphatase 2C -like protein [Escovopsis weberi]|uniref:Protein phosphatase 2C-like protein n=1 Tax=Escovopsis weberi TaxID=150374 RepID=A0A0M9VWB0_ESCWE|nr:Protein phosphatase 2C -like protein [Escovopsis weberi]
MALRDTLLPYVSWCLSQLEKSSTDKAIDEAIKDAFLKMDARIMGPAERCARSEDLPQCSAEAIMTLAPAMTGSGALVAAFDADTSTLRVALTGDARAVLGRWCPKKNAHTMDALTEDQNGFNAKEISRLDKEHPGEIDRIINRQSGKLMSSCVTRSFGDHRWKWPGDLVQSVAERFFGYDRLSGDYPTPSYLTASPEVTTRKVRPKDFLILASGGLWNHISRETAVECVSRWVAAKRTGGPEEVQEVETVFPLVGPYSYPTWGTSPQYFAIEDMDNAAICLAKNALGGSRRNMFRGMMSLVSPFSHLAREDISIQVMFFEDPHLDPAG